MGCIFCKIISGEIPARILSETRHSISFLDAFPLAMGHALVVPKNHHEKVQDMPGAENADLFSLVHTMASRIDSLTGATLIAIHNGRNAGQEIPHLHVHIVPRSKNDSAGPIHGMFAGAVKIADEKADMLAEKLRD